MWKGDSYLKGVSIPILKLNGTDSLHLPSTLVFLLCYGLNSFLIRGTATGGRWKSGSRLKALYLSAYALLEPYPYKKGGRRPSAYEWIKNELSPSFLSNCEAPGSHKEGSSCCFAGGTAIRESQAGRKLVRRRINKSRKGQFRSNLSRSNIYL